jgi:predicted transcriptional regulator
MPTKLTESDLMVLLAKQRRRLLLSVLYESGTPLQLGEIAERIGKREYEDPTGSQLDIIHLSLYHNHVPRLEAADVIRYDENEGTVTPHLNFDQLVRVLERMLERDLPWSGD